METQTLTLQFNDEQLPILQVESAANLTFRTCGDGNELVLTGNKEAAPIGKSSSWYGRNSS